ncbi:MAG: hypothetical protein QM760_20275 [Nibricoccus sp.]
MAKSSFRSRTVSAALVTLGCSLGVSLTPELLAAEKKAEPAQLEANQQKDRVALEKTVTDTKTRLEANQWKCREFEKSLTPETAKLEANQVKLREMKKAVENDTVQLKAAQEKLAAATKK